MAPENAMRRERCANGLHDTLCAIAIRRVGHSPKRQIVHRKCNFQRMDFHFDAGATHRVKTEPVNGPVPRNV